MSRVDDVLNLVKLLASKHGPMQQTTLNPLSHSLLRSATFTHWCVT